MPALCVDIYVASHVEFMGPNRGRGGYGVVLHCPDMDTRKVLGDGVADSTDYRSLLLAVVAALGSLRQQGLRLRMFSRNKSFCQSFSISNKLEQLARKKDDNYNQFALIEYYLSLQESFEPVWLDDDGNPLYSEAKQAAVEASCRCWNS